MTDPTDKFRRPGAPARRFSSLQPAQRKAAVAKPASEEPQTASPPGAEARDEARVAKVMARAGLCSRRDAEAWIKAGRIAVNGTVIDSPALNVGPDDTITVDGSPIEKAERTRLFLFHKPRGLVTTAKDPEGRPTIYDALDSELPRLVTVGRLDINTEGLLLLTNDGGLSRMLELPSTGWLRRYRVRANGTVDQAMLDGLAGGITIDGVEYAGIEAKLDRVQGANTWITMGLREGKNREIKRVLEHLGLVVNRLIRVSFGPFQLGDLAEGAVEEISTRVLRDQLGTSLAREAGVDFEGPVTASVVTREVRQAKAGDRRKGRSERGGQEPQRARPARPDRDNPRQHVSSLRAAREEAAEGPRRKTERSATEDRKGRAVTVERITTVARKRDDAPPNRNARRFERDRSEKPAEMAASPAPGRSRPPRTGDGGPRRPERTESARPRTLRQADREPRAAADPAPPRETGRRAAPRGATRNEGERFERRDKPTARPARSAHRDERPRDERSRDGAPRPPRGGDKREGGFGDKPRAARQDGAPGRLARWGGGKSFAGKADAAGGRSRPDRDGDRPRGGPKPGGSGKRPGPGGGRGRPGSGGGGGRGRPPG